MTSTEEQIRSVVARQAADWFMANQDAAPDYPERAAFIAWLKSSPIHIEEYLGVALVARDLPAAADDPDISLESLLELARAEATGNVVPVPALYRRDPAAGRVPVLRRWSLAGAAAMVVLAASVFWWITAGQSGNLVQTYQTAQGQQALQRLPDGSVLHMNTETVVAVNYDRGERVLRIDGGQALFEVAHDDSRRFRVVAGDAEIVAVGTQFDVRMTGKTAVVTVVEGRVDVYAGTRRRVEAGYQLRIDDGIMPEQSKRVDVQAAIAWLQRKIVFEREPLGEVADEFNRYGIVRFVIEDAGLRALPVSGVFYADDTDSFTAFLASLDGIRVERTPGEIHVMRRDAAEPSESPAAN